MDGLKSHELLSESQYIHNNIVSRSSLDVIYMQYQLGYHIAKSVDEHLTHIDLFTLMDIPQPLAPSVMLMICNYYGIKPAAIVYTIIILSALLTLIKLLEIILRGTVVVSGGSGSNSPLSALTQANSCSYYARS